MVGKIIGLVSCLMCAFPFLIISVYNKDSREPINFWSGCIFRKNCASVPEERSAIPLQTEQSSAG